MHRQSTSRNHRSKGIKVKHVLQICLLLAVCFWLIYQVKHSHDKKKEFEESDAKVLLTRESSGTVLKLGRKDIQPRLEETTDTSEKRDGVAEEEEETTGEDVEENRHEEDEPEEKKVEAKEDEETDAGDDETDEHGQEKIDEEVDRGENIIDEKERVEGDENGNEEKDSEDGNVLMEKEGSVEETDQDGDDTSTHEAREENYKGDDASSAVTHDTQIAADIENENEHEENSGEQPEDNLEQEFKENNSEETDNGEERKELEEEVGEIVTTSEAGENLVDNTIHNSSLIETVTEATYDNSETGNSSTEVMIENHNSSLPKVNGSNPNLYQDQEISTEGNFTQGSNLRGVGMELTDNSILNVDDNQFGSNSTGLNETKDSNSEEFSGASNNAESLSEKNDATETEKLDTDDNRDEILESENIQQDSVDLSDLANSLEEKDVRTDLDTLPEIQTEGTNSEDSASE